MANLNLSEFTEKLFVADADHTFIWDTAASISKRVSRNSWLNSGTLTSDAPVTISQTWNAGSNAMTALKVVATDTASGATSNLLELWAGSTPALDFAVTKAGVMQAYGTYSSAGANYARLALACDSSGNATISTQALGTGTAGVLAFSPGNSERMRITAAGNVGIGTTNPISAAGSTLLTISHAGVPGIYWQNTSAVANSRNWNFLVNGLNFEFQSVNDAISSSTVALRFNRNSGLTTIDSVEIPSSRLIVGGTGNTTIAGNVGIGTTSPTSKLQVSSGDVEVDTIAKGVILKSPDGTRYRVTVANGGTLSVAAV